MTSSAGETARLPDRVCPSLTVREDMISSETDHWDSSVNGLFENVSSPDYIVTVNEQWIGKYKQGSMHGRIQATIPAFDRKGW